MTKLAKREWPSLSWPDWFTHGFPERFRWPELLDVDDWVERDSMRMEEFRENGTLVVKIELPGIDPDKDVELTVADHVLTIRAERKEEQKKEEKGFFRSEFRYGQFVRRVPLPVGASEDDVKASYSDGILEVRLPIREEEAAARKVPISRG